MFFQTISILCFIKGLADTAPECAYGDVATGSGPLELPSAKKIRSCKYFGQQFETMVTYRNSPQPQRLKAFSVLFNWSSR